MSEVQRRVTRTVEMSARAVAEGLATLPEGVSYLYLGGPVAMGYFPHAADPGGCDATLLIRFKGSALGVDSIDAWCTREEQHGGQHVAHLDRGIPMVAWTDAVPDRTNRSAVDDGHDGWCGCDTCEANRTNRSQP